MQKAVQLTLFLTVLFGGHAFGNEDGCNKDFCKCQDNNITCDTPDFTLQLINSTLIIVCKNNMSAKGLGAVNGLLNGHADIVGLRLDACALSDKPLSEIIHPLEQLESLVVVGNKRYNYTISSTLQDLNQIKNLSLINLGLKPGDISFEQMTRLTLLDLSRNNFTQFPVFNEDVHGSLIHLNVSYNNITLGVGEQICHLLTGLHILDLSGNPGIMIHSNSFQRCSSLTELHLAHFGLSRFSHGSLSELEKLSVINLSANGLKNISTDDLMFSWNSISDRNISINLSNNKIHDITAGNRTFTSNVKIIKALDLSGNSLSKIDEKVLDVLNLHTGFVLQFKMGGNPWRCNCGLSNTSNFVRKNSNKVVDLNAMKCSSGRVLVKDMTESELCSSSGLHILLWIAGFAVLFIVLAILNFVYKRSKRNQYIT